MPISEETKRSWMFMVTYLKDNVRDLNDWEAGFVDSLDTRLSAGGELTWKQSRKLREVFEQH